MSEKEILLSDYQAIVSQFCVLLAKFTHIHDQLVNNESVTPAAVDELTDKICNYQKALLAVKDRLNYTDGLSFLDDCKFRGFTLSQGKIEGLTDDLIRFVTPWVMDYPSNTTNNYKFEVGSLLIALAHEQIK